MTETSELPELPEVPEAPPPVESLPAPAEAPATPEAAAPAEASEAPAAPVVPAAPVCRHEYVKIIQRRIKGLERRLVSTKAYLPVGFKMGDFSHLSEGAFCFCTKCRARLFPRRTAGEKAQARLALAQGKQQALLEALMEVETASPESSEVLLAEMTTETAESDENATIHVEELELESPDVQDIEAEGVKINDEEEPLDLLDEEV